MRVRDVLRRLLGMPPAARPHPHPTPANEPRLMLLTDHAYPTYLGTRAWCSGLPYWPDGACQCRHSERFDV